MISNIIIKYFYLYQRNSESELCDLFEQIFHTLYDKDL